MKMYAVLFLNFQNGVKQYREYPKQGYKNYKSFLDFLNNRNFLKDYICEEIKEYDPIKTKNELADKIGQLIYGL